MVILLNASAGKPRADVVLGEFTKRDGPEVHAELETMIEVAEDPPSRQVTVWF